MSAIRVGVVSDSPVLTTGYGVVTDVCCRALSEAGHEVIVFGLKHPPDQLERSSYFCPVWPVDPSRPWDAKLRAFASASRLDVLFVYMDVYNLDEVMSYLEGSPLPPMALYAIFDGMPVRPRLLHRLGSFRTILVTTQAAADYLQRSGLPAWDVAPPGVDLQTFRPLDAAYLRREAGLDATFTIGVFGRNTERKQQVRVLQALHQVVDQLGAQDVFAYFHCQPRGHWDLPGLARELGVSSRVLFAEDLTDETCGVPLRRQMRAQEHGRPRIPRDLGYVERINLCNVAVNLPHSGDFEQVLIEAPACGVPALATDDGGIMRAALGPGVRVPAFERAGGNAGQPLHFADPAALAKDIHRLRNDPRELGRLRDAGLQHARAHPWSTLRQKVVAAVERTAGLSNGAAICATGPGDGSC
jgi:glycosyltransferase involved in cell wall biosynthesis